MHCNVAGGAFTNKHARQTNLAANCITDMMFLQCAVDLRNRYILTIERGVAVFTQYMKKILFLETITHKLFVTYILLFIFKKR